MRTKLASTGHFKTRLIHSKKIDLFCHSQLDWESTWSGVLWILNQAQDDYVC